MENQRSTIAVFLAGGIAAGVFAWQATMSVTAFAALEDQNLGGVLRMSSLLGLVVGALTFGILWRHDRARNFVDSVWAQLFVAHWPSREETANNTMVVVGATIFFAALLSVYDLVWGKVTDFFLYSA